MSIYIESDVRLATVHLASNADLLQSNSDPLPSNADPFPSNADVLRKEHPEVLTLRASALDNHISKSV